MDAGHNSRDPASSSSVSPPARVRSAGHESLWKRAQRTLGTQDLSFLEPQARASSSFHPVDLDADLQVRPLPLQALPRPPDDESKVGQ